MVWTEGQIALGAVGYGLIAVVGVIPILQSGEIEVDTRKHGIGVVASGALGPRENISGFEEIEGVGVHDDDGCWLAGGWSEIRD